MFTLIKFSTTCKTDGTVVTHVIVKQTQALHQPIWPSVFIMKIVEQPLVCQNISITTTQPTIATALTCVHCQELSFYG
jgi:hypothetical protein